MGSGTNEFKIYIYSQYNFVYYWNSVERQLQDSHAFVTLLIRLSVMGNLINQ